MAGPFGTGSWQTWDQVLRHVASGDLRETHLVELKGADYADAAKAKRETVKDIASLAIDGGAMIVGIVEDEATGAAESLAPIPLDGVIERIDQICASRISPPLAFAQSDRLRDPADTTRGLLVIEVPATGIPHMADGVYVG